MVFNLNCKSQDEDKNNQQIDRQPYAAGRFYSNNPSELRSNLAALFANAIPKNKENVIAVVSPHAGYVFSGEVAASAFNQIDNTKEYENIFVLASSHVKYINGASIYYQGDYITPLGNVKVNTTLAKELVDNNKLFSFDKEADANEHSLEVQLPFLQYYMKTDFKVVPIIIGSQSKKDCENIAKILKPYFYNDKNLFIISTDFSHYPSYDNAVSIDQATADAVLQNSPKELINTLEQNAEKGIYNLATSMCGWTSVLTMLYMTQDDPEITISPILYKNSGDSPYGEKDRVVGYYALAVSKKKVVQNNNSYNLTGEDKENLLHIARNTLDTYIQTGKVPEISSAGFSDNLNTNCGAFVTLLKDKKLRGCIGRFKVEEPVYQIVQQMAVAASTKDTRFAPVKKDELGDIEVEISVLTPLVKIDSIDEIILGKHGIYIKKGYSSGTFLPQVATETGWTLEEFLGHCARDKARIGWDGWENADIYIYEAIVFSEDELH